MYVISQLASYHSALTQLMSSPQLVLICPMSAHSPCLHTYPLLSNLLHIPPIFPPYYTAHESVLLDACRIPSGIESLLAIPDGGIFPLQSEGNNNEGDEDMIQLHVPRGGSESRWRGRVGGPLCCDPRWSI